MSLMPGCMRLRVVMLTGREFTFTVYTSETIMQVKRQISAQGGPNPATQKLIYCGVECTNDQTLKDIKIQNESTLHLVEVPLKTSAVSHHQPLQQDDTSQHFSTRFEQHDLSQRQPDQNTQDNYNTHEARQHEAHQQETHQQETHQHEAHQHEAHQQEAHQHEAHQHEAHQRKAHQHQSKSSPDACACRTDVLLKVMVLQRQARRMLCESLKRKLTACQQSYASCQAELAECQQQNSWLEDDLDDVKQQKQQDTAKLEACQLQVSLLQAQLEDVKNESNAQHQEDEHKLADCQQTNSQLLTKLCACQANASKLECELEDLNNQLNSVNAKRQSELEQLAICQQSNLELENRLKQADNVVQGLFKRTLCDADELGCLKRNSETLARDNQTLVAKFQAQEQRFHDLMQKLKALHDNVKEVRATSETPQT